MNLVYFGEGLCLFGQLDSSFPIFESAGGVGPDRLGGFASLGSA